MTEQKFYRTVFQVEVLSTEPPKITNTLTLSKEIMYGKCSGALQVVECTEISEQQFREELTQHDTKLDFFGLNEENIDDK